MVIGLSSLSILFSFNSQPPEGGWKTARIAVKPGTRFNSQPPEGGWANPLQPLWF